MRLMFMSCMSAASETVVSSLWFRTPTADWQINLSGHKMIGRGEMQKGKHISVLHFIFSGFPLIFVWELNLNLLRPRTGYKGLSENTGDLMLVRESSVCAFLTLVFASFVTSVSLSLHLFTKLDSQYEWLQPIQGSESAKKSPTD